MQRLAPLSISAIGLCLFTACASTERAAPPDALQEAAPVLEMAVAFVASAPASAYMEARASQYSDSRVIRGKVEFILAQPGKMRMTGLSPTDDMVSIMVADGERFTSFERGSSSCYVGRACPETMSAFASIALEPSELVGVLMGRPPIIAHKTSELTWDKRQGAYLLTLQGTGEGLARRHQQEQKLWVAEDGRILRTSLSELGKVKVDVRYSRFKTVDGAVMPHQLDVKMARDNTDLRLEFKTLEPHLETTETTFQFSCPVGTTMEELMCGGMP